MKTALRAFLWLTLIVWIGAEVFFPAVAAVTFMTLSNQTHVAGTIVGTLLRILHVMGLTAGVLALLLLALAPAVRVFAQRAVIAPMVLLVVMIGCTAYSQFGIIPAMERDRVAAGGAIDTSDVASPYTTDFNRLHVRSTWVEETILLLGIVTVVLVARAEETRDRSLAPDRGVELRA